MFRCLPLEVGIAADSVDLDVMDLRSARNQTTAAPYTLILFSSCASESLASASATCVTAALLAFAVCLRGDSASSQRNSGRQRMTATYARFPPF